jgi:OmpA-OmpF porin, OOP family
MQISRTVVNFACGGFLAVIALWPLFAQDKPGSQDHPLFTRMAGYSIARYEQSDFDAERFQVIEKGKLTQTIVVEGKRTLIVYSLPAGSAKIPSTLEVVRNYTDAAAAAGGIVTYENSDPGNRYAYMKFAKQGKEIWARLWCNSGKSYELRIVEKASIEQQVTAEVLGKDLTETGHTAVYGILFDTGKADIKPGSEKVLTEIAGLLQSKPAIKLYVVGHTDNVGALEMNMKLSQARAESVVIALTTKHGVAAARLRAFGSGPIAPVASNASEEGRAKNRRVELVEQ